MRAPTHVQTRDGGFMKRERHETCAAVLENNEEAGEDTGKADQIVAVHATL